MNLKDCFYIGYISRTRGLKGELQLFFEFEDYDDLEFEYILVDIDKKLVPFFIETIAIHSNSTAFLTLSDIDHIDKTTILLRKKVYLPNSQFPERDPDDFRITDLVGYLVIDEQEGELGKITHIQEMPQQFMATVSMNGQELLFPLNDDLIIDIDKDREIVEVRLPEGLVDLYKD